MDLCGYGVLVDQSRLHLSMGLRVADFNMDKFRYMCILSGCDYLASLPGIGLNKARKFIVTNTDPNIYNVRTTQFTIYFIVHNNICDFGLRSLEAKGYK